MLFHSHVMATGCLEDCACAEEDSSEKLYTGFLLSFQVCSESIHVIGFEIINIFKTVYLVEMGEPMGEEGGHTDGKVNVKILSGYI